MTDLELHSRSKLGSREPTIRSCLETCLSLLDNPESDVDFQSFLQTSLSLMDNPESDVDFQSLENPESDVDFQSFLQTSLSLMDNPESDVDFHNEPSKPGLSNLITSVFLLLCKLSQVQNRLPSCFLDR